MNQNTVLTAIISGAICLAIGFGSGALLTKPDREKIKSIAQQETKAAKDEIERLRGEQKSVTIELEEAKTQIARRDVELNLATIELKQTNDELAKVLIENSKPQVTFIGDKKDTLKGLRGVGVEVVPDKFEPEIEKYGLTKQQLQTDIELRLRQNGIRVLSEQERLSTAGCPYLSLSVNVYENSSLAAYTILLQLKQTVFLERDPTKQCYASTWFSGQYGFGGVGKIEIRDKAVKDCVDEFINDHLAVNPKE